MSDVADKLAQFQTITGLQNTDMCTEILSAHGGDLFKAIASVCSTSISNSDKNNPPTAIATVERSGLIASGGAGSRVSNENNQQTAIATVDRLGLIPSGGEGSQGSDENNRRIAIATVQRSGLIDIGDAGSRFILWKLVTLPIATISVSLGLISGAIALCLSITGGVLSYSVGLIGLTKHRRNRKSSSTVEAMDFVLNFEREYGNRRPDFVPDGFMEALRQSRREVKLLFVYLHSPEQPETAVFCEGTLCCEVLSAFVNENFVAWGANVRANEGLKMTSSLEASRFPFCAVVMAAANQRISLLRQIEGSKSSEEMLALLQKVLEENGSVVVAARIDVDVCQVALEANQARQYQRKEEEEAHERTLQEAAEREDASSKQCEDKYLSLGPEPEKGPDITQVFVRLPNGERKGRRFHCNATMQSLYDFVDSLGCLEYGSYTLVTFFPRVRYGPDKLSLVLEEVGLYPQASLFVELNS